MLLNLFLFAVLAFLLLAGSQIARDLWQDWKRDNPSRFLSVIFLIIIAALGSPAQAQGKYHFTTTINKVEQEVFVYVLPDSALFVFPGKQIKKKIILNGHDQDGLVLFLEGGDRLTTSKNRVFARLEGVEYYFKQL